MKRVLHIVCICMAVGLMAAMAGCKSGERRNFERGDVSVVDYGNGLTYKTISFTDKKLFGASHTIRVIEIVKDAPFDFMFTFDSCLATVREQAGKCGAFVAINASFFDTIQPCYLRMGGVKLGENARQTVEGVNPEKRKYFLTGTLVLEEGRLRFLRSDTSRVWEDSLPYENIMSAGPMLIYDSVIQPLRQDRTFVTNPFDRTAICQKADGSILMVVADQLNLMQFADVLSWLGCCHAISLDGGPSTTMVVDGEEVMGEETEVGTCIVAKRR